MNKTEIREYIRRKKREMSEEEIQRRSALLAEKLFESDVYKNAGTVYGYVSYNQEVRTLPILERALRDGKRVAVPKVFGDKMKFICITDLGSLEKGYGGILEPTADGPIGDDKDALVLMPGLAFDRAGHRIGYGGGFYDKFLAEEPGHPTVALCYDFQVFERIETEEHDIPAELVLWA